ncbi:MAG: nitrogenase-associated protein [Methylovulum sp.]|nr:nitrogenase-associated protein [Methylovulum sp.]
MATVIFYEKPGCVSNTRQKQMLVAAGHQVIAKNLLAEPWQPEVLRAFFADLSVRDWFNYSAPAIKNREIDPDSLSAEAALAFMVAQPLLIRRPLMQVGTTRMVGFDPPQVDAWLGLVNADTTQDVQSCAKTAGQSACRHE